jgi:hypothetical protein
MDNCPVCGADTRPGDNYCLNCGQRLLPNTPSPSPLQQAQPTAQDYQEMGTIPSGPSSWIDPSAPTIAAPQPELSPLRESLPQPTVQATLDQIEKPACLILRAESGETLQEYPLDKAEIVIGRAPTSDILLSKDKLTSRRHAIIRYEDNQYHLYDEHSANGTFINSNQIEDSVPYPLHDGDRVGIGEHELVFYAYKSSEENIADLPTCSVQFGAQEPTYITQEDSLVTIPSSDDYGTSVMDEPIQEISALPQVSQPAIYPVETAEPKPVIPHVAPTPVLDTIISQPQVSIPSSPPPPADRMITFGHLTTLQQPALPDLSALIASLSTLDGQVTSLQEQFNITQEAMRNRDAELAQQANQLRDGIRSVAQRMDNTIADVARSRETLAWAELLQLMEDVMNNPRDIEYVTKLARKARELNKVFQIHQNVLNTMAECNSLLRGMISDDY